MSSISIHKWHLVIVVCFEILALAGIAVLFVLLHANQKELRHEQNAIHEQVLTLHEAQLSQADALDALIYNSELSVQELDALRTETQAEFAEQRDATSQAVDSVRTRIEDQLADETSTAEIVHTWNDAVALLMCGDRDATDFSRGSGTIFQDTEGIYIMTNRHVVTDTDGNKESGCYVTFPRDVDEDIYVSETSIERGSASEDWARIRITHPTPYMKETVATDRPWCTSLPPVGEDMLILGYPSIGIKNDVTATTGIVSGYEDEGYLISTAKIDRGNSGGAAIWLGEECYVGIPTKVHKGAVESLARILTVDEL